MDEKSGLLKLIQLAENSGKNPRHIAIDPSGRWIVISDVGTGDVLVLGGTRSDPNLSGRAFEPPSYLR